MSLNAAPSTAAEVTVIMVSYNTRDITLRAIETLLANAGDVTIRLIVWDNASHDGSADAIAAAFPQIELIRSDENLGFAVANNRAAELADSEWLLLLNPDTETHPRAVEALVRFGRANPASGIVGGRTVFPDGSLNYASCLGTMTLWSLWCNAVGLAYLFPDSPLFNREAIGGWQRDSVRQVDVVVGCLLLIRTDLWRKLGGFDAKYFMFGEEHDLCLRAAALGYRPAITPDAQIVHLLGASTPRRAERLVQLLQAKATILRDHWRGPRQAMGLGLLWLWAASRRFATGLLALARGRTESSTRWQAVWSARRLWMKGY